MKKRIALAVLVFVLAVAGAAGAFEQVLNAAGFQEVRAANGMVLQWKVEQDRLHVILSGQTGGWVGVGFNPSDKMKDANFIIGYVEGEEVVLEDHYGTHKGRHTVDTELEGSEDLIVTGGGESNGITRIEFTIPLDSGDASDRVLVPGNRYPVLLAYGKADDLKKGHSIPAEAKGEITL
jgi:hypothetical protein